MSLPARPLRRRLATGTAVLLAASACVAVAGPGPAAAQEARGRYLVQFAAGVDAGEQRRGVERRGGRVARALDGVFPGAVVDLTPSQAAELRRQPGVRAVEADQVFRATTTQSGAPWGLDRVDQRALPLSGTFTAGTTGSGVTAYVVDTGVLSAHAELAGRVAPGHTVVADGRGTEDCNGHGTHVAGTTAGTTYGVAKGATVVPVRVLGCDGAGSTSGIISALDWVVAHHQAGTPAVANLSLGGGTSSLLDAAVDRVVADGVTVVVAAGNSGADACTTSPARAPRALTVGATGRDDTRASWSNWGSCVDLFAPGAGIVSAWHTGSTATATSSGTSMAAPHVAGAVAALLQSAPASSPATVASALLSGATTGVVRSAGTGSPDRLLHADPALRPAGTTAPSPSPTSSPSPTASPTASPSPTATRSASPSPTATRSASPSPTASPTASPSPTAIRPAAPTGLVATARSGGADLRWTPGADGGSPVRSQRVTAYAYGRNGRPSAVGSADVAGSVTQVALGGLRRGTTYAFTVTATNAVGTSPASALSNAVTAQ